jgi:hypothetical protein
MYQIFGFKLQPKEIELGNNIDNINKLNWYSAADLKGTKSGWTRSPLLRALGNCHMRVISHLLSIG